MNTKTKNEISADVAERTGMTKEGAKKAVDAAISVIADALVAGDKIQIAGLGVFGVKATAPRQGRNPQTGAPVAVPAGKKVTFKPAADLKGRL